MEKITLYYTLKAELSSDTLLKLCAAHLTGRNESDLTVHRERGKKPYFENFADVHFSVSHSGSIWICAFAESEIGCDIQLCREDIRYDKLSRRWFHPTEAESVLTPADFCRIWSRKEAFVKAAGIGIDQNFKKFDVSAGKASLGSFSFAVYDITLPCELSSYSAYSAAVAYREEVLPSFVCIDSII